MPRRLDDVISEAWERFDKALQHEKRDSFWRGHERTFNLGMEVTSTQYANFIKYAKVLHHEMVNLRSALEAMHQRLGIPLPELGPVLDPPPEAEAPVSGTRETVVEATPPGGTKLGTG